MKISNCITARKAAISTRPVTSDDLSLVERYILNRYEVSPSLARTIACVAMLGGQK
jgi:hypothetical protein